jgi:hypothetical protein
MTPARDVLTLQAVAGGLPVCVAYDGDRRAFVVTWTTPEARELFAGRYASVAVYLRGLRDGWHWSY